MQAGGAAQADPQAQLEALVDEAMTGNENALKALQQIMQSNPQLKNVIEQMVAAKQGGGQEVPQEENGGSVPKAQDGIKTKTTTDEVYIPATDKTRIPRVSLNSEGYQFPTGSVSTAAVYDPADQTTYTRNIWYGVTPAQNDTVYGVSPVGREAMSYGRGETPNWLFDEVKTKSENAFRRDPYGIYKCGGKVKKGEKGLPIPSKKITKNAQGGCPCKLHRVGGKIVEVDSCTGLIVK